MPERRWNQPEGPRSQMDRLRGRSDFQEAADGSRNIFSTEFGGGEYWDGQEGF